MKLLLAAVVVVGSVMACASRDSHHAIPDPGGVLCPAALFPGMLIEVRDAVSGAPAACDAAGRAEDGGHLEPLSGSGPCGTDPEALFLQGVGQPGVYTVTIEKAGYQPWVTDRVEVTSGVCGLVTVVLRADLVPL